MSLKKKIGTFKQKSYQSNGIGGVLVTLIIGLSLFLILTTLEYSFWFNAITRTIFFYLLIFSTTVFFIINVLRPFLSLFKILKQSNDEKTAQDITDKIPELEDKLINYLQLKKQTESDLTKASILQKTNRLSKIDFAQAIDVKRNRKYGKYLAFILLFFGLIAFVNPPLITNGVERLVRHNEVFVRPAPFSFVILNDSLETFRHQDFELRVQLSGKNLPNQLNLVTNQQAIKLTQSSLGTFTYLFEKPSQEINFHLESVGFSSRPYQLKLYNRPELKLMSIALDYPDHTFKKDEIISNSGNLTVPEGTIATWSLDLGTTNKAIYYFPDDTLKATRHSENSFSLTKELETSGNYQIKLKNAHALNESSLIYHLNVVPDQPPSIRVDFIPDTVSYKYILITGEIEDDYGFFSLELNYQLGKQKISKNIPINSNSKKQSFYTEWIADTIAFEDALILYATVRDNDRPRGFKAVKSTVFVFEKPDLANLAKSIDKKSENTKNQLDKATSETEALQKSLQKLAERLKSENELSWQEEKSIRESIKQRKELEKRLKELKKKHEDLLKANQNFDQSQQLKEKSEQLNRLIKELMDEETRQLYEELQKLLAGKKNVNTIRNNIEQINRQENRMQKDLKRIKELFKRQKIEIGLEQASQQLDSLATQQLDLSKHPIDSSTMTEQTQIQKSFEEIARGIKEIVKLNQELAKPEPMSDMKTSEKDIKQEMENVQKGMKSGDKKKSQDSQQKAGQKMQQMSKKMQQMQAGMALEVMQENIEQLQKIMDDLIRLSYRQESILQEFNEVSPSDPRFLILSNNQVKLKKDIKVLEDSLMALAGRVVQLSSFITKEIESINNHMTKAVTQIKERQRDQALAHQQFSMTSMNNLALLLSDVLQQMQMTMAEGIGKGKAQQQNTSLPNLRGLQQQLSEQIKRLKEDGKSGQKLSEELARMAAKQEMIRQQLQKLQDKLNRPHEGKKPADNLQKAIKLMKDNEVDLVNKRLTQQLLNRQKEITTRMLEAEDALKVQQKEPDREAEIAKKHERLFPPNFEKYLIERKKEIELLRTIPVELTPFYKKEVSEYFRRLSEKQ